MSLLQFPRHHQNIIYFSDFQVFSQTVSFEVFTKKSRCLYDLNIFALAVMEIISMIENPATSDKIASNNLGNGDE